MSAYHLIFVAIDLALLYPLWRNARTHVRAWREASRPWHAVLVLAAALLLALAAVVWSIMLWSTIESWSAAMDPSRPKPFFEVVWALLLCAFGVLVGVAQPLHVIARGRVHEALSLRQDL